MNLNSFWLISSCLALDLLVGCGGNQVLLPQPKQITNSIGMKLVRIPRGKFLMGSTAPHPLTDANQPQHSVTITKPFYLGAHEVTQQELAEVLGYASSKFHAEEHFAKYVKGIDTSQFPADHCTWGTARLFCEMLTNRREEIAAGRVYRLPTEAEWEYACRAGTETPFACGSELTPGQANITTPAIKNTDHTPLNRPTTVGSYPPNAWGLYDMHGNTWEWCKDGMRDYTSSHKTDPEGPISFHHIMRGGAWDYPSQFAQSDYRTAALREYVFAGFRVVCEINK